MRYSYEFKIKCIEMYNKGVYHDTPEGVETKTFRKQIRNWVRIEEICGSDTLRHKAKNKDWTPEERLELVSQVIAGASISSVSINAGINTGMLYQWVCKYKIYGYNGLISKKKGRKPNNTNMKKTGTTKPPKLNESEYEELIRLRAEVAFMKAENEVIKKQIALRKEKEAARLKAKKQQSLKNFVKKDTN